jgi:hypothetical protein
MNIDPKKYRPSFIQPFETVEDTTPCFCKVCKEPLPKHLKYYCTGKCLQAAKDSGLYGHEEAER